MVEDARFEDGIARPLRLIAESAEDVVVLSGLAQDAVFVLSEASWQTDKRRFAILINRFRWEDHAPSKPPERARALLVFDDVTHVVSQGLDHSDPEMVMSLLSIVWSPGADGAGRFELVLAGDGAIAVDAECVNVTLQDVTRPYLAPSGKTPEHPQ